jgi:hypothetical protein
MSPSPLRESASPKNMAEAHTRHKYTSSVAVPASSSARRELWPAVLRLLNVTDGTDGGSRLVLAPFEGVQEVCYFETTSTPQALTLRTNSISPTSHLTSLQLTVVASENPSQALVWLETVVVGAKARAEAINTDLVSRFQPLEATPQVQHAVTPQVQHAAA